MIKSISPVSFGAAYRPYTAKVAKDMTQAEKDAFKKIGGVNTEISAANIDGWNTSVDENGIRKSHVTISASNPYFAWPVSKGISIEGKVLDGDDSNPKDYNVDRDAKLYMLKNPRLIKELEEKAILDTLWAGEKAETPEETVKSMLGVKGGGFSKERVEDFINMARGMFFAKTPKDLVELIDKAEKGEFGKDKKRALLNIAKGIIHSRDNE